MNTNLNERQYVDLILMAEMHSKSFGGIIYPLIYRKCENLIVNLHQSIIIKNVERGKNYVSPFIDS